MRRLTVQAAVFAAYGVVSHPAGVKLKTQERHSSRKETPAERAVCVDSEWTYRMKSWKIPFISSTRNQRCKYWISSARE
jgi:hypothetical protein